MASRQQQQQQQHHQQHQQQQQQQQRDMAAETASASGTVPCGGDSGAFSLQGPAPDATATATPAASATARNQVPGATMLAESLDERVMVLLRDGRCIVGVMRSYDQFANIMLQGAYERVYAGTEAYCELDQGTLIVRGENVAMLGLLNDTEDLIPVPRKPVSYVIKTLKQQQSKTQNQDHQVSEENNGGL